jgi:hypothetical protein
MKCAVEMGSYIPSFIKISLGIQKLLSLNTHRQHGDLISLILFIFFKVRTVC